MVRKLFTFLLMVSLFWLFACKSDKTKNSEPEDSYPEVIEFKTTNYEKKFGDCSNADSLCHRLSVTYLQIKNGPQDIRDSINNAINTYLYQTLGDFLSDEQSSFQSLDEYAMALINDYKNLALEFDDFNQKWNIDIATELKNNDDYLISVLCSVDSYMGGAHPNHWKNFLNFDAATGKKIIWQGVIADHNSFIELAEAGFRKDRILNPDADFEREGYFFKDGIFSLPENIGYTSKGILLIYNPYEVAPYSMGSTEFVIPWEEVKDMLKDDFKK